MGKNNNVKLETLLIQMRSLCENENHKELMAHIENEFNEIERLSKERNKKIPLYKMFHANRFVDTNLRLFLEIHNCRGAYHSIGQYLDALAKTNNGLIPLANNLKDRYKRDIADVRNKYIHSSGQYPTNQQYEEMFSKIQECLQKTLSLHI